jgi:hypothetical protein
MPDSPRRRFQFPLSTLFCVTLLVAIWAFGMRILGSFDEPIEGWILFTAACAWSIWTFVRIAVRHHQHNPLRLPPRTWGENE